MWMLLTVVITQVPSKQNTYMTGSDSTRSFHERKQETMDMAVDWTSSVASLGHMRE
jgi:hypothetical protein